MNGLLWLSAALLTGVVAAGTAEAAKLDRCFKQVSDSHPKFTGSKLPKDPRWRLARCDREGTVHLRAEYRPWMLQRYVVEFAHEDNEPILDIDFHANAWELQVIKLRTMRGPHVYLLHPVKGSKTLSVLEVVFKGPKEQGVGSERIGREIVLTTKTETVRVTIDPAGHLRRD